LNDHPAIDPVSSEARKPRKKHGFLLLNLFSDASSASEIPILFYRRNIEERSGIGAFVSDCRRGVP
jgi:hypothetical protein